MEKLIIKNFGPISDIEIELKKYVVLIGDTSTGKSVIAKLICIFQDCLFLGIENIEDFRKKIKEYNIPYLNESSQLEYYLGDCFIKIEKNLLESDKIIDNGVIKGIINIAEKNFQNIKSHDYHVIMTQLLPVALRGLLPENVRLAIVKLCAFLNAISQKVIDPEIIPRLRSDVAQCLVSFELVFPPSFFNIMTHVLVHLVDEIVILGPVFLHNMFPFERFMGVLKKYVRNRARPEGSISMGHQTEDVIGFCVDFIPGLNKIGLPKSRYEGRLTGKGTLGRDSIICRDGYSWSQAHYTVLQNSTLVTPYVDEHKNSLRSKHPEQCDDWITCDTSGLSAVGWKHVSEVTTLFVMSCTCCPGDHLRLLRFGKDTR